MLVSSLDVWVLTDKSAPSAMTMGGCSGRTLSWVSMFGEVLLNQLLVPDLVDDVLSVADETEGCHDDKTGDE